MPQVRPPIDGNTLFIIGASLILWVILVLALDDVRRMAL